MLTFNLRPNVQFSVLTLLDIVEHCFLFETPLFSMGFQALTLCWFLSTPLAPFSVSFIHPSFFPPTSSAIEFGGLHRGPPLFSLCLHSISKLMSSNAFRVIVVSLIYFLSQTSLHELQTHIANCLPDISF